MTLDLCEYWGWTSECIFKPSSSDDFLERINNLILVISNSFCTGALVRQKISHTRDSWNTCFLFTFQGNVQHEYYQIIFQLAMFVGIEFHSSILPKAYIGNTTCPNRAASFAFRIYFYFTVRSYYNYSVSSFRFLGVDLSKIFLVTIYLGVPLLYLSNVEDTAV